MKHSNNNATTIGRFATDNAANLAITFAAIIPLFAGAVGIAVDYSRALNAKSALQEALDAATFAAASEKTQADAKKKLDDFLAYQQANDETLAGLKAKIVSFDSTGLTVSADADMKTTFAGIFGVSQLPVAVQSSVAFGAGHQELHFVLDLSGSLGMAATPADRVALEAVTQPYVFPAYGSILPQGCAFACHQREGWEPVGKTVYQIAHENSIKLREDELMHQFGGLVDILLDPTDQIVIDGKRKVGVIGFSGYAKQLIAPSASAADVKAAMNDFPLHDRDSTQYAAAFAKINEVIGAQGNGGAGSPDKVVILITDGIESRSAFFAQNAIDTSLCQTVKDKGFTLAVVELKYPKLTSNSLYNDTVLPVETTISPGLAACASTGWHFTATNNSDIPVKFNEIRAKFGVSTVRLTQ